MDGESPGEAEERGWWLRDEHFQKGALGRGEALGHLIPGTDGPGFQTGAAEFQTTDAAVSIQTQL